jgi:hypothetical protein
MVRILKEYLSTHEAFFLMVIIFLPVFTYIEIIFFSQYSSHPQPDLGPEERVGSGKRKKWEACSLYGILYFHAFPFSVESKGWRCGGGALGEEEILIL